MNRWTKLLVAAPALGGLLFAGTPARGEESGAVKKDRARAEKLEERMDERREETADDEERSAKERVQTGADQAADATRVGGAKAAEKWHQGVDAAREGTNRAAKKVEGATD
jgi:outer membrane murein-binding lipoprotein Lpp